MRCRSTFFCPTKYMLLTFKYFIWIFLSSQGFQYRIGREVITQIIIWYQIFRLFFQLMLPAENMENRFEIKTEHFLNLKIRRLILSLKIHSLISAAIENFYDENIWKVVISLKNYVTIFLFLFSQLFTCMTRPLELLYIIFLLSYLPTYIYFYFFLAGFHWENLLIKIWAICESGDEGVNVLVSCVFMIFGTKISFSYILIYIHNYLFINRF